MQYMVKGADGKEYGPTDLSTLKTWATEGRLAPHSMLRDFSTGQTMPASSVPGLFESLSGIAPPVPAAYPRGGTYQAPVKGDHGGAVLGGVIFRCVIALVLFFALSGIGLISAAYAMFYAVQCQQSGSKYGIAALSIAGTTLALIGIGWAFRLSLHH